MFSFLFFLRFPMFGKDTKYLNASPPIRVLLVLFAFSLLSSFLLVQCKPSDQSSSSSSTSSESSVSSSSSDSKHTSSSKTTRAEGFEQGPSRIEKKRTFDLTDSYTIGPIEQDVNEIRAWLEVPLENKLQTVEKLKIDAGALSHRITEDPKLSNRFLYVEIDDPKQKTYEIVVKSRVTRKSIDKPYREKMTDKQRKHFLRETSEIPVDEEMRKLSRKHGATDDSRTSLKKIYDFVVDNSTYYKANPAKFTSSGPGDIDAKYCLFQKQGGCTDFHALYLSMGRSIEIPSRFIIGSYLPETFAGKDKGVSYHCWAEAHLDGEGWLTLDAAYGDLWPDLQEFYFGQLDARRVAFSRGRNIQLVPEASSGRISYFIKGFVEADGKPYENWNRKLTFTEVK